MEAQTQSAKPIEFPGIKVPEEAFAPIKSVRGIFDMAATPDAQEREWAMSGYNSGQFTRTALNGDHDPQAEEKKKEEMRLRAQMYAAGMKTFADLSFDDVIENFTAMSDHYAQQMQKNNQAIVIDDSRIARDSSGKKIETTEELRAFEEETGFCSEQYAVDQVTMHNGQMVSVQGYQYVVEANEVILDEQMMMDDYRAKLESGEIKLEELPQELQDRLVEVENNGGAMPAPEFNLGAILESSTAPELVEARMLPVNVVSVTPTFAPAPSGP